MLNKIIRTLRWVKDIQDPEMIECRDYTKHYLGFESIIQQELNIICDGVNNMLELCNSDVRITNHMGEIIPCKMLADGSRKHY